MSFADLWLLALVTMTVACWASWADTGGYPDAVVARRIRITGITLVGTASYLALRLFFFLFPDALAQLIGGA